MPAPRLGALLALALLGCSQPGPRPDRPRPQPFDLKRDLGLAFVSGASAVLYATREVAAGTPVQVALPRKGRVLQGRVLDGLAPREEYVQRPFGPAVAAMRAKLRLAAGDEMPALGIALIGAAARLRRVGDGLQVELDGAPPAETFRACTSAEGAHLTVWSGKPLAGRRVWHAYYYLGYDTEMDCTPGDV